MVTFVILHYNGILDTLKCVDSIVDNLSHEDFTIVVVDNNSKDNGGDVLKTKYMDNTNIHLIKNTTNYGFSKGNNIGCEYAKNKIKPNFICVINNDVYIESSDFINKIEENYERFEFDVLGPQIWNTKRHYNQNPINVISSLEEINESIKRSRTSERLLKTKLPIFYYLYNKIFKMKPRLEKGLHGAALIFSKKYLENYSDVFPEYTFMYGEEHFLFYRKITDNLIYHYDPSLKVLHNHSSSTRKSVQNITEKWFFQHKYMQIALFKLKEIYENNDRI